MMSAAVMKPYLDPLAATLLDAIPYPRKALLLDRDGVVNVDHGYVHSPQTTDWMPGIFEICRNARRAGFLLVVVTNQAGIARGYYNTESFLSYTRWVHEQFTLQGCPLIATYYCPHLPNAYLAELRIDCDCRKPKPGMILSASRDLQLDLSASFLIGDKFTDLVAAKAAKVGRSLLVKDKNTLLEQLNSCCGWDEHT